MRKALLIFIVAIVSTQACLAQEAELRKSDASSSRYRKLWKISAIALLAATALDAHSSWGHRELNPALRGADGRFGAQAVAVKGLLAGGVLGVQHLLMKDNERAVKYGAITNLIMTGAFSGAAAYNYKLHSSTPRLQPGTVQSSNPSNPQ